MSSWMRRCGAALIIGAGAAALIAMRLNDSEDDCDANVSFYLRGTHSDCLVREPAAPPPIDMGSVMVGRLD